MAPTDLAGLRAAGIAPRLAPGEDLVSVDIVVPAAGARGISTGGAGALGARIGDKIGQHGAVKGADDSLAATVPATGAAYLLALTGRRLLLFHQLEGAGLGELVWEAPREAVAGVERKRRVQIMAKFVLHFADGSAATFMTMRRATIDSLAGSLGTLG